MRPILIVGGYGTFGSRAAERLALSCSAGLIIAGRDLRKAEACAAALARSTGATITAAAIDAAAPDHATIRALAPAVVLNASGPFQAQDYTLARAAIAAGAHYVDLADARAFVTGITALDDDARRADVLVVSGASSVPALSSAVVDAYLPRFSRLDAIDIGISPANRFDPGLATTRSILGAIGRPHAARIDGRAAAVYGWQGLRRHRAPGIGARWLACCDVPDLALFPARYPTARTIMFRAGLEVPLLHFGLWGLSWIVRAGLLHRPDRLAAPLLALKRRLHWLGSDTGLMYVAMTGADPQGATLGLVWRCIARRNHGPSIPQAPATVLAARLAAGRETRRGATACIGLLTLADIRASLAGLDIDWTLSALPP
jgi:hypothetical protein